MSRTPFFVERNPYFLAGTTELNERIYGFSSDLGDVDRYYLDAAPGKTYIISVSGVEADTFDPKLVIRNRAGDVVASSSGAPGSYDPVINFKTDHGGGYTIDVVNEDDLPGSFSFLFSIQEGNYTDPYSRPYEPLADPITGLQDLETKASFYSAIGDSVVTKKELQDLLSAAGDGGVVSAEELQDLRLVSGNLSTYLAPDTATYYQQIFDNVVLGSVANKYYTAGTRNPEELGDLHAGSSSAQLDKLIGKWFLGSDLPNPIIPGDTAHNIPDTVATYAKGAGPLFEGDIDFASVNQGVLGDCWFVASTASIAEFRPETIKNLFIDNGDGTYGVRFWKISAHRNAQIDNRNTSEYWVTINKDLPVHPSNPSQLLGMGSTPQMLLTDQLWPALLEKAAAQASGLKLFSAYRGLNTGYNAFSSLHGGLGEGLAMLEPSVVVNGANKVLADLSVNTVLNSPFDWQHYLDGYQSAKSSGNGQGVVLSLSWADSSLNPIPPDTFGFTFRRGHAYGVVGYDQQESDFTIYNPWGSSQSGDEFISPFRAPSSELYSKFLSRRLDSDIANAFTYSVV